MRSRSPSGSRWVFRGAVSAFVAVALGAFGAHGLKSRVEPDLLTVFETGVRYQFYHSIALVLYGLWRRGLTGDDSAPRGELPAWGFLIGIVLFSGSLYLLVATGVRAWGMVTPLGGLAFLVGWLAFAWEARTTLR